MGNKLGISTCEEMIKYAFPVVIDGDLFQILLTLLIDTSHYVCTFFNAFDEQRVFHLESWFTYIRVTKTRMLGQIQADLSNIN